MLALDFRRKFGRRGEEEDDDENDEDDGDGGEDVLSFPVTEEVPGNASAPFPPTDGSGSGGWSADDDPPERKRFSNPLIALLPSSLRLFPSPRPRGEGAAQPPDKAAGRGEGWWEGRKRRPRRRGETRRRGEKGLMEGKNEEPKQEQRTTKDPQTLNQPSSDPSS